MTSLRDLNSPLRPDLLELLAELVGVPAEDLGRLVERSWGVDGHLEAWARLEAYAAERAAAAAAAARWSGRSTASAEVRAGVDAAIRIGQARTVCEAIELIARARRRSVETIRGQYYRRRG